MAEPSNSENIVQADKKTVEWLKERLKKVWGDPRFCGLCFDDTENLNVTTMEFVIGDQKYSKSLIDIMNYVFNGDVEDIMANSFICDGCTEKTIQAYLFIHNTKQLSKIINNCVTDLYSKVVDITEQVLTGLDCENANIMIVLENDTDMYESINDLTRVTQIVPTEVIKSAKFHTKTAPERVSEQLKEVEKNKNPPPDIPNNINVTTAVKQKYMINDVIIEPDIIRSTDNDKMVNKFNCTPNITLEEGKLVIEPLKSHTSSVAFSAYKCEECDEIFSGYRRLKSHQKIRHNKVLYQCHLCHKNYNTQQYLDVHFKVHGKTRCKICTDIIPADDLFHHLRNVHSNMTNISIYPCEFCEVVYYSNEALDTHFKATHLVNVKVESQCVMCLKTLSEAEANTHKCKFVCSECTVMPCIHYKYLTSYREQILNHSPKIKCIDCDYMTVRKEYLITHVNREHLDHHPFTCDHCSTQFYTKMSLKTHIDQYHQQLNICQYCDQEFKKSATLRTHRSSCKLIKRVMKCDQCPASFDDEIAMLNHKHLRHDQGGYPCELCNRRFLDNIQLDTHKVSIHRQIQVKKRRRNIVCTLCDVRFNNVNELLEHESSHESNTKFPCRNCSKNFYSLKKLYVHQQRHYNRIQCEGCKKKVIEAYYPQHTVRCPYKREKSLEHMCESCGKSFHLESLLKLHQKCHMKPIPCEICNKLVKPNSLSKHMELHTEGHRKPEEVTKSMITCTICSHPMRKKVDLDAHMNRYHYKIKPYVCGVCKKDFCGLARLKEHLATHTTDNECFCSICGKKFANKVCLKMHFRMHTGESPYNCDECGEKFRSSSMMKTHKIKKHLEKTIPCPGCSNLYHIVRDMRYHFKKAHWKYKDRPFDYREAVSPEYYHLFEDGRVPKLDVVEDVLVKHDIE